MLRASTIALIATLFVPSVPSPRTFVGQAPAGESVPAPATVPAEVRTAATVIERDQDGLFYLDATVNGRPVRFVVDSGANVVVLNAADAARTGVATRDGVSVETAAGSATMHRTRLQTLKLAGQELSDVDAVVVQRDLAVSLLGQSALTQMRPITFRGNRLEFQ